MYIPYLLTQLIHDMPRHRGRWKCAKYDHTSTCVITFSKIAVEFSHCVALDKLYNICNFTLAYTLFPHLQSDCYQHCIRMIYLTIYNSYMTWLNCCYCNRFILWIYLYSVASALTLAVWRVSVDSINLLPARVIIIFIYLFIYLFKRLSKRIYTI